MQQQLHPSPFLALYDRSPERRSPPANATKASIWAPQPQPSDVTWPRAIEAFSRCVPQSRDDMFGTLEALGTVGNANSFGGSASGAATPDLRSDSHVEQLLRTLNLNSPEPQHAIVATSSPKSTGSAGSGSIGSRGSRKPVPPPLDLSFGSNSSSSASASDTSASATSGSITTSTSTSTSTANSSLLSLSAPHRSRSFEFDSVPYQQQQQQLSAIATGTAAAVSVCPDSPDTDTDFSPLSFSSALLTPLDSPHSLSPVHSANIGIAGLGGQHSPIRAAHAHLHNLGHGHGHGHGFLHSPTHSIHHSPTHSIHQSHSPISTHSIHHSPTHSIHASPLHSPTQLFGLGGGLGYPNTKDQQRFTSTYGGYGYGYGYRDPVLFNGGGSEPPSPGYGVGVGQYSPPGHGSGGRGYASGPLASANGRFLPLPASPNAAIPALPNNNNKSPLFTGEAPAAAYYHHQATTDAGEHWIRGDASDGMSDANVGGSLGLGAGFAQAQSNSPGGAGAGFVDPGAGRGMGFVARDAFVGASANGLGVTLGPEDLNALRGSLAYHQQQLAQQQQLLLHHQRQQEALALANANANASANANNEFSGSKDGTPDGRGRRGSDSVPVSPGQSPNGSNGREGRGSNAGNEPINFLSLLHPSSSPPYATFVSRIIKSADQQASIFLQQKLKVAGPEERARIVDAICARGAEMMMHRFGNWAVQRCLEAATTTDERRKLVACMRGRVVDLATNCYGCHVLQKALDCEEEEVRLLIVSELLMGDPAHTLVNKHASHVWSKIMELSWTPPAPPIFAYVNKSLKGKWAALACHETGSLVVQHAFENLEDSAKDGIVAELLGQGLVIFGEVAKSQWGSYCIQHILEHGSEKHRQMALEHLLAGLLDFATNEQGSKSVVKALKEGGTDTLDKVVKRMCEPAKGARRAMIVDLALSLTGSQLIASVLPNADKEQRAALYDCIRGHIVTLRGCKTGSKVIWLFDRMRAYYGY